MIRHIKYLLISLTILLYPYSSYAEFSYIESHYNDILAYCLETTGYDKTSTIDERMKFSFEKVSRCSNVYQAELQNARDAELRDFMKANPRYAVPGQSLNKCWGKPRVQPFDHAWINRVGDGFEAGIVYKKDIPAGSSCYETAPWDNRDLVNN